MANCLAGLRVIDLSQNLAGPYCTQILVDLGAEVIKVEPPGGDPARAWGPPFVAPAMSAMFAAVNRGKRSVVLDLKDEAGVAALTRLVAGADIFVQSFRAGVAESLGFGVDALRTEHPRLIYVSVTAYGDSGPLRDLPGYDSLAQAHGGLISVTGTTAEPARVGTSVVDLGTGVWGALGVLAGLRERERTGHGSHVVAALYETALAYNAYHLLTYLATGQVAGRHGTGFAAIAPYGAFPAADGELMIAGANDSLFRRLCDALDLREVAEDPRFHDNAGRVRHRADLDARVTARTREIPLSQLEARLRAAGVPCAPVTDMGQVAESEQTRASGMLLATDGAAVDGLALPVVMDQVRPGAPATPPALGEHTTEVLQAL